MRISLGNILSSCLTALLALVLLTACSSDEPQPAAAAPDDDAGMCELVFTIDPGANAGAGSRADRPWDDPYPAEPGTAMENRIATMDTYFVTADGRSIAMTQTTIDDAGAYHYSVKIDLTADYVSHAGGIATLTGRVVAVANYPGTTAADPFNLLPCSITEIRSRQAIPMWGVATLSSLHLIPGERVDAGSIRLLRAVPKVSIRLADDLTEKFTITAVEPDQRGYPTLINCQPANATSATDTGRLLIEGCFNPIAVTAGAGSIPDIYGLGTTSTWMYPGERSLLQPTGLPMSFSVQLTPADGTAAIYGQVYLCDYTVDGTPDILTSFASLVRNHDYQYTISLRELEFVVSFRQWIYGGKAHIELE